MTQEEYGKLRAKLDSHAAKIKEIVSLCTTEEQTKISLINPYIELLDFDVRDPRKVQFEYVVDVRSNSERVDYAILGENQDPVILIEAKSASQDLSVRTKRDQIRSYADQIGSVKFMVLTNGVIWQWFKKKNDRFGNNVLADEPFLEYVALQPSTLELPFLNEVLDNNLEHALQVAEKAELATGILEWLERQQSAETVDDILVGHLTKLLYGRNHPSSRLQVRSSLVKTFHQFIEGKILERLDGIREPKDPPKIETELVDPIDDPSEDRLDEVETKTFQTQDAEVSISAREQKRAWRPVANEHWVIEKNASDVQANVLMYLASQHKYGAEDWYRRVHANQPRFITNDISSFGRGYKFRELGFGFWTTTTLNNANRLKLILGAEKLVVLDDYQKGRNGLVEVWLPLGKSKK